MRDENGEKIRIKLILNYVNIFMLFLSILYSILLFWGYYVTKDSVSQTKMLPTYLGFIIPIICITSFYLNRLGKIILSKHIIFLLILTINLITGIKWGFDLPSVLISYIFCIVIITLISKTKENILYLSIIILSIFIGNTIRDNYTNKLYWYSDKLYINDIIEFSIMFIFITFMLIKFNYEQNKAINRSIRAEYILKKERDNLEKIVGEKTQELQQIQKEKISKIYHLIEFGKLSSGLYHDLITPIQTMNLYIERLNKESYIKNYKFSQIILNIKNTHEKLNLMLSNIRKQIKLDMKDEKFNLTEEIKDLITLIKNNYIKNGVNIEFSYQYKLHVLNTKKTILNHIILNLISNAYEACLQDKNLNTKDNYLIKIITGKNKNKNYISIIDNGIGIKKEDLKKIYTDFYSSKNTDNCGIGLSSSKYFTEKYLKGNIFTESEYNLGTTMTIIF